MQNFGNAVAIIKIFLRKALIQHDVVLGEAKTAI